MVLTLTYVREGDACAVLVSIPRLLSTWLLQELTFGWDRVGRNPLSAPRDMEELHQYLLTLQVTGSAPARPKRNAVPA